MGNKDVVEYNVKFWADKLYGSATAQRAERKGEFKNMFSTGVAAWVNPESGKIERLGKRRGNKSTLPVLLDVFLYDKGKNVVFVVEELDESEEENLTKEALTVLEETEIEFNYVEN